MDLFKRNQVWPAVRKATVEYRAGAFPGDVLSIETVVTDRGTTSFTMQHVAKRLSDGAGRRGHTGLRVHRPRRSAGSDP